MSTTYINSYPELEIEYELPFYLRSIGLNNAIRSVDFPDGHNRHYIGIVHHGELSLTVDSHSCHLTAGDAFFIRSHFSFNFKPVVQPTAVHWLVFDGFATIPLFSKLGIGNYIFFHNVNLLQFASQFTSMYMNSLNPDKMCRLQNSASVYKVLIDLYTSSKQNQSAADAHPSLLRGKHCIEQFYATPLTQKDIADAAGVTSQYLCRLFQTHMHTTPITYLNQIRIEHAKHLLSTSSLPIQTIGERVGFTTPHYFSHTFVKIVGITPSKYREASKLDLLHF